MSNRACRVIAFIAGLNKRLYHSDALGRTMHAHPMRPLTAVLLAAAILAGGCAPGPSPSPTYPVPADAPIHPADCGWPADTDLAFAAWVDEPEQAGLPAVYALASVQRRRT